MVSYTKKMFDDQLKVLILVVVEDGLVPNKKDNCEVCELSLNPCCSGRWSRTLTS